MYAVSLRLIVDIIVERKIVKQRLWAKLDLSEVWIDGPVS
jgi:hypothetical protein